MSLTLSCASGGGFSWFCASSRADGVKSSNKRIMLVERSGRFIAVVLQSLTSCEFDAYDVDQELRCNGERARLVRTAGGESQSTLQEPGRHVASVSNAEYVVAHIADQAMKDGGARGLATVMIRVAKGSSKEGAENGKGTTGRVTEGGSSVESAAQADNHAQSMQW